jgi:hypothetical protein
MVDKIDKRPSLITENFKEIDESPVLKEVDLIDQVGIVEKTLINEHKKQDIIEIREQPIVRNIEHEPVVIVKQEDSQQIVVGEEEADLLKKAALSSSSIEVDEEIVTRVIEEAPEIVRVVNNVTKQVHHFKIITEIRERPVIEIHRQKIVRVIREEPVITTIQSETVYETQNDDELELEIIKLLKQNMEQRSRVIQREAAISGQIEKKISSRIRSQLIAQATAEVKLSQDNNLLTSVIDEAKGIVIFAVNSIVALKNRVY